MTEAQLGLGLQQAPRRPTMTVWIVGARCWGYRIRLRRDACA